jgi:uncharacterized protein (TIGR02246 family)
MKIIFFLPAWLFCFEAGIIAQENKPSPSQQNAITALIERYSGARERSDTTLLKTILTNDVDQLVSNGEWRTGTRDAIEGMMKSSAARPGARSLVIDRMRMLRSNCAIVDCRYEIVNADNTSRKMWSSFIVVDENGIWKISAIRNMLPAVNQ